MIEKIILKILSAVPMDHEIAQKDIQHIIDISPGIFSRLWQDELIHREWRNTENESFWQRTVAGNNWIQDYHRKNRERLISKMTCAILFLAALPFILAAIHFLLPFLWR